MFEKVYVVPVSSFLFPFPTETSCYVLFAYPAMQFVDCILIGREGGGTRKILVH